MIAGVGVSDLRIPAAGLPVKLPGFHDNAAQGRPVSADEFGCRMNHNVRPVFDRTDQEGGSEGVVNDKGKSMAVSNLRDRVDIRDITVGIAECLQIDSPCVFLDGTLDFLQIVGIHEGCRDAELGQCVGEQVITAAVYGLLGDNMPSVRRERLDRICDRRGSGSQGQRGASSLEGSQSLLQHILGGIGQPSVNIARVREAETVGRVLAVVKDVGSRLVDRYRAGICSGVRLLLADMKLKCLKSIFTHFFILLFFTYPQGHGSQTHLQAAAACRRVS